MTVTNKQVLITGATGFLGRALAKRLIDEGVRVRIIARTPEKAADLSALGAEIIKGDLTDAESVRTACEGCEIVFHVAVNYTTYEAQQRVNVTGTQAIAQAAADAGVKRFVHVSTTATYGAKERGDLFEDHPLKPGAYPYAITKVEGERVVREICNRAGMPYTIVRPGMIYGPGAQQWTNMIFNLAKQRFTIWLDGGQGWAHYIYVDDVVDLMVCAADHPKAIDEVFNVSADPAPTWREVLDAYSKLAGKPLRLIPLRPVFWVVAAIAKLVSPPISMGRDLPDLLSFMGSKTTFKISKARDLLGWAPRVSLEDGVARCADSLREQGLLR
ncbi:MAG: NAD(P)-dependent oxidoreductase [Anaerolineae bacterium]